MSDLTSLARLRLCHASDDALLYDIFCTTWQSEVAALPNQNLAQHVLRIQHIAQERRFAKAHPGYERFVVMEDGEPAGRLYVHRTDTKVEIVDLTLLTAYRSRGIGTALVRELFELATREDLVISLRVGRRQRRVTEFYLRLGFDLVDVDDLDNTFEWTPARVEASQAGSQAESLVESADQLHQATPRA
jgi:GNAT superfamily N-acetyltransferase